MPAWLVEPFAGALLTKTFWAVTLMTLPCWVMMIFLPKAGITKTICRPLVAPVMFALVWAYLAVKAWELGIPQPTGTTFGESRDFAAHPMVFLASWCQLQVLQLFLGCWVYQDSIKRHAWVPAELLACWLFGPLGLMIYAIRAGLGGLGRR